MTIKLGQRVRDKITNFEGLVIGRAEYITSCDVALVQPEVKKDGDFVESRWIDEPRLVITNPEAISFGETAREGGADQMPPRR